MLLIDYVVLDVLFGIALSNLRHAHESLYGRGPHLLHHPGAVSLGGPTSDTQLLGDGPVGLTGNHQIHHFTLARGESYRNQKSSKIGCTEIPVAGPVKGQACLKTNNVLSNICVIGNNGECPYLC